MPTIYAFGTVVPFIRQDYVRAPQLEDANSTVAMQGGNRMFRTFSIKK